jgi:hypothetical protein
VPGDLILTRDEGDESAPAAAGVVVQAFRRHAPVLRLVVRGREVVLTSEHPFYTLRAGWTPARQLVPGDLVLGRGVGRGRGGRRRRPDEDTRLVQHGDGCPAWRSDQVSHSGRPPDDQLVRATGGSSGGLAAGS